MPPDHHSITHAAFRPAWWCTNPQLQTLWPLASKIVMPALGRERIELDDGDFLDLDWVNKDLAPETPTVMIMHGLEGSSRSHYARRILDALGRNGYRAMLMHFRGCSGEPNRLPRRYHSGETGDIAHITTLVARRYPTAPLAHIGYSLGGNVLLKWLGETGAKHPAKTAIAISVPFELATLADHMMTGFARIYQKHLVDSLNRNTLAKAAILDGLIDLDKVPTLKSFWDYDDAVTAPLHGFASARAYYDAVSSRQFLKGIEIPTLIIHAKDDPFMTPKVIPTEAELGPGAMLEVSDRGGHVGFIAGGNLRTPYFWLETRILRHLSMTFSMR